MGKDDKKLGKLLRHIVELRKKHLKLDERIAALGRNPCSLKVQPLKRKKFQRKREIQAAVREAWALRSRRRNVTTAAEPAPVLHEMKPNLDVAA